MKNHLSISHYFALFVVFGIVFAVTTRIEKQKGSNEHKRRWTRSFFIALLVTYIFFILLITLIARTPAAEPKVKLVPFWSWYEALFNHDQGLLVEIILNVLLFLPVGLIMRLLGVPLRPVFLFCLIFSFSIELTQYFTCRGLCEWFDDVFGNTSGGVLGWYVGKVIRRVWSSYDRE